MAVALFVTWARVLRATECLMAFGLTCMNHIMNTLQGNYRSMLSLIVMQGQYAVFGEQLERIVRWVVSTGRFLPSQNGFGIRNRSALATCAERFGLPALNMHITARRHGAGQCGIGSRKTTG